MAKEGLGIIFESGASARITHALSIAIAGAALNREVKLLFTFGSCEFLRKKIADNPCEHEEIIELLRQLKRLGGKCEICATSMATLNIARDELIDEVDRSTGLVSFLSETVEFQLLYI